MSKAPSRPRDPNQLAKRIVDIATSDGGDYAALEKPQAAGGRVGDPKGGSCGCDDA